MTPGELQAIMDYLRQRVHLKAEAGDENPLVVFDVPTADEMAAAGLNPGGSSLILGAPWWEEMVEEILETPEMCDPADSPEQVLEYARDVVSEYIRKRAKLS